MRGLFVGVVGALAIAAAAFGLALDGFRAGPFDRPLDSVEVAADVEGTYLVRPASAGPVGVCLQPPCEAFTEVDLLFRGLPPVPYDLRLQGPTGREPLGTFEPSEGAMTVRWSQTRDHSDKERIVLAVAGHDVGTIAVRGGAQPSDVAGPLALSWQAQPATLHVNEIGGVALSSIATTRLADAPPAGWEFRARFEGPGRWADLGALETDGAEGAVLDGRVERVGLEEYELAVIVVAPVGSGPHAGFPVLQADLWP